MDHALRCTIVAHGNPRRIDARGQCGLRHEATVPHCREKIVLGHDPIAVLHKVGKQIENLRLDRYKGPPRRSSRRSVSSA